jgi:hypothetical protein
MHTCTWKYGKPCNVVVRSKEPFCKVHTQHQKIKDADEERASRNVKLCTGYPRNCKDGTELPLENNVDKRAECIRKRSEDGKRLRDEKNAALKRKNAESNQKECVVCHESYDRKCFQTERKKGDTPNRLGDGLYESDKCQSCRGHEKSLRLARNQAARLKAKREQNCCMTDGCTTPAYGSTDKCIAHGGGTRCNHNECTRSAQQSTDFCWSHGGGHKCVVCMEQVVRFKDWACYECRSGLPMSRWETEVSRWLVQWGLIGRITTQFY